MNHVIMQAAARAAGRMQAAFEGIRRRHRERRMVSALQSLSDADLKDIGVYRCEIPSIARIRCAANGGA